MCCGTIFSQKLTVTSEGLKNSEEIEKNYVVIQMDGKTSKELYENAVKYVNKNYKNPTEAIKSTIENEYLKFETYAPNIIIVKNMIQIPYAIKFTTELSFKEGKIKYEILEINMFNPVNKVPLYFSGSGFSDFVIFNKKGVLKRESTKNEIENYFNSQIISIKESLTEVKKEDKW